MQRDSIDKLELKPSKGKVCGIRSKDIGGRETGLQVFKDHYV